MRLVNTLIVLPIIRKAKFINIEDHEYRSMRVLLLKSGAKRLHDSMKRCDFKQDILVRSNGDVLVISDGVSLDSNGSNRYLKVSGKTTGNEGSEMLSFLKSKGMNEKKQ